MSDNHWHDFTRRNVLDALVTHRVYTIQHHQYLVIMHGLSL
jgi:hypothetical protein